MYDISKSGPPNPKHSPHLVSPNADQYYINLYDFVPSYLQQIILLSELNNISLVSEIRYLIFISSISHVYSNAVRIYLYSTLSPGHMCIKSRCNVNTGTMD